MSRRAWWGRSGKAAATIAAVMAIAALVMVWMMKRHTSASHSVPAAVSVREGPRTAVANLDVAPPPEPGASVRGVSHGPDEMKVCGGGWVKFQPDGSIDPAEIDRAMHAPEARAEILAKLKAGPEIARLAGMLMAATDGDDLRRIALLGIQTPCEGAECAAKQVAEDEVVQLRQAIASAAVASRDPKVYALGLNVCGQRREGACQLLNARQLARLDPGNANSWLRVLDEARARNDVAEQNEALFRIANADRNAVGWLMLSAEVFKATPPGADDTSALAAFGMTIGAVGIESVWGMPGYSSVSQLCGVEALRDANRAQVCAGVASVLAERSDTMIGRNIGGAIGTRLGWPAERVDRMRGEWNAYVASLTPEGGEVGAELGCARMRREIDRLRQTITLGEVGVLREWVARSGKKPADFIREERARQREAQRARAEAAVSAPSAASAPAPR